MGNNYVWLVQITRNNDYTTEYESLDVDSAVFTTKEKAKRFVNKISKYFEMEKSDPISYLGKGNDNEIIYQTKWDNENKVCTIYNLNTEVLFSDEWVEFKQKKPTGNEILEFLSNDFYIDWIKIKISCEKLDPSFKVSYE